MNARNIHIMLMISLLLLSGFVFAQGVQQQEATPAVTITVVPGHIQLQAGKPATLGIRIAVPAGHHAYLDTGKDGGFLPIDINCSAIEQAGFKVRRVTAPPGTWDEQYHATVLRHEGVFEYELTALPGAKAGSGDYTIAVGSQICSDANGSCYFPRQDTLHVQLNVIKSLASHVEQGGASPEHVAGKSISASSAPGGASPTIASPVGDGKSSVSCKTPATQVAGNGAPVHNAPKSDDRAQALATGHIVHNGDVNLAFSQYNPRTKLPSHGLLVWILLAFIAGLVMNFMPCVLPVMSIKVLSLVQQGGESRRRAFGMGVAFAAGMMTVFLALAMIAILFGLGWGEQFQSQTFLIVMIAIVFAFALSLFGVYEFGVPMSGSLAAHSTREGFGNAFLKGMLASLLATPCSGPFLGSTLAWTLTQPAVIVLVIFATLGFGMSLPYVVLSAHPAFLKCLPKPGAWMETFKHAMGFVLLATVVYLMVSLNQQHLLLTIVFLFCVAVGGWIWGRFSMRSTSAHGRIAVLAAALLVIIGGAYLSFHTMRGMLSTAGAEQDGALTWEQFDPARLLQYQSEGRSVFLDFTADWCANCKFNEMRVYNSAAIRRQIRQKHVVVMKADLTCEGPSTVIIRRLMKQLGARSIPFLAVFPGNQPSAPYTLHDLVDTNAVSNVLRSLPDATEENRAIASR